MIWRIREYRAERQRIMGWRGGGGGQMFQFFCQRGMQGCMRNLDCYSANLGVLYKSGYERGKTRSHVKGSLNPVSLDDLREKKNLITSEK